MKLLFSITIAVGLFLSGASAQNSRPIISLEITNIFAYRLPQPADGVTPREIVLECIATVDNQLGTNLTMGSCYGCFLDGLFLTIMDANGKMLQRRPFYNYDQAPYSFAPLPFPLSVGRNIDEVVLPIYKLPISIHNINIRVDGKFPGSAFTGSVTSSIVGVKITDLKKGEPLPSK